MVHATLEAEMQITRSSTDTQRGSAEWFTGAVYIDAVAAPVGPSRARARTNER